MAFMMPVMKNNYEIYPAKPKRSNSSGGNNSNRTSRPNSRNVSECEKATNAENTMLSPSPPSRIYSSSAPSNSMLMAAAARPQRTVRFCRSASQDRTAARRRSNISRASTSSSHSTDSTASCSDVASNGSNTNVEASSPKFGSFTRFHCKLVDSLKRKLRIKDESEDDATVIRAST